MQIDLSGKRAVVTGPTGGIGLAGNRPSNLLGHFAEPEEVASLAVYVASPRASATTGSALRVDGGTVETIA